MLRRPPIITRTYTRFPHPARFRGSAAAARHGAARALDVRELLLQAAEALGIVEPDPAEAADGPEETREEALIRTLIAREVRTPEPDEVACRRYYENNLRRFRSEDLYQGAHILFAADPADAVTTAQAKTRAEAALEIGRAPSRERECQYV